MIFVNLEEETKPAKMPEKSQGKPNFPEVRPAEIQKLFAIASAIEESMGGPYYIYRKRSMIMKHVSQTIAWLNLVVGCLFYILVRTTSPKGQGIIEQIGCVASFVFFADVVVVVMDIVFLDILYTSKDQGPYAPMTRRYVFSALLNIAFNLMVLVICVGPLAVANPAKFTCVFCFLYTVCAFVFVRTFEPPFEVFEGKLNLEQISPESSTYIEIRIHTPEKILRYI